MPSFTTDMEKCHFGDGAADHGKENEYALDFGGMLHAADDGALHHHIYEFFQPGLATTRQDHQLGHSTFQECTFPNFPPYLPAAPAFPQESTFRTSTEFSSHIQRNQFKAAAGTDGLPTSTGSCIDHRGGPTSQYAPEKSSSMDHVTNEIVAIPRSGYDVTSCSPNTLKRASSPSSTHRAIKSQKISSLVKMKRPMDQAEHILRERIRRDGMTSKFRMLESLIPPGPKRDRATIVEDSIQYLKNLHHRVKDLKRMRSEMKSSSTSDTAKKTRSSRPGMTIHIDNNNIVSSRRSEPNDDTVADASSIEKVEVHLDLPREIVIEMTCRSHGHIQSQILQALERLRMDVVRCNISKLHDRVVYVVVVKPQVMGDPLNISNDVIIRALKRALDAGL